MGNHGWVGGCIETGVTSDVGVLLTYLVISGLSTSIAMCICRMGDFNITFQLHSRSFMSVPGTFSAIPMPIKIKNAVIYAGVILIGVYILIIFEVRQGPPLWCTYWWSTWCLRNYTGTSAFADVSYLMADVTAKFFCIKIYWTPAKCRYWQMLMNIVSQTLCSDAHASVCAWCDMIE